MFDSIRKFLQFQLTINVAALVISFVGAIWVKSPVSESIFVLFKIDIWCYDYVIVDSCSVVVGQFDYGHSCITW